MLRGLAVSNLQAPLLEPVPVLASAMPEFVIQRNALTLHQCEELVSLVRRFYRSNSRHITKRVDIAYVYPAEAPWLFSKVAKVGATRNVWDLAISAITEPIRIQRYRRGDYSDLHCDYDYTGRDHSKLTITIPLIDPSEWQGGKLEIGNGLVTPNLRRGDAVVFPSFSPHRVTRINRGARIVLSAWLSGPPLR